MWRPRNEGVWNKKQQVQGTAGHQRNGSTVRSERVEEGSTQHKHTCRASKDEADSPPLLWMACSTTPRVHVSAASASLCCSTGSNQGLMLNSDTSNHKNLWTLSLQYETINNINSNAWDLYQPLRERIAWKKSIFSNFYPILGSQVTKEQVKMSKSDQLLRKGGGNNSERD